MTSKQVQAAERCVTVAVDMLHHCEGKIEAEGLRWSLTALQVCWYTSLITSDLVRGTIAAQH
jgi:hypothetical protein